MTLLASDAEQAASPEFALGGQAVIEGVMMRSPHYIGVAVRRESGEIVVHDEQTLSLVSRRPRLNVPLVRGTIALFESLSLGLKALNYAANVAMEDAERKEARQSTEASSSGSTRKWVWTGIVVAAAALAVKLVYRRFPEWFAVSRLRGVAETFWTAHGTKVLWIVGVVAAFLIVERLLDAYQRKRQQVEGIESALPAGAMAATIGLSLAFGIALFVLLPNAAADWMKRFTGSSVLLNLYEGIIRIVLFVGYVSVITLLPDIRRVFQYHGAEHKVVWMQERGLPLTPENARPFSTAHPRCGTSFALFVLVLSIVVFTFLGWPSWPVRIASRLLLLPVIAGLSYEILKLSAKRKAAWAARLLIAPGLWLQKLTTREPDDEQVAVAIRAMEVVLQREAEYAAAHASAAEPV